MAGEAARRKLTLDEFLAWDGPERRYQLFDGEPVARPLETGAHGTVQARLGASLIAALAGREPCRPVSEAGVASVRRARDVYVADIAVTCAPDRRGARLTEAPLLLVEILSESTAEEVRKLKLPEYRLIPSVREVLLLDSRDTYAEVHRRLDEARWLTDLVVGPDGVLRLESVPLEVRLADLYRGLDLPGASPAAAGDAGTAGA